MRVLATAPGLVPLSSSTDPSMTTIEALAAVEASTANVVTGAAGKLIFDSPTVKAGNVTASPFDLLDLYRALT